jgi:hypothetical protein
MSDLRFLDRDHNTTSNSQLIDCLGANLKRQGAGKVTLTKPAVCIEDGSVSYNDLTSFFEELPL